MTTRTAILLASLVAGSPTFAAQPYKGEILKVDAPDGKIMIKQGAIKKFDMEAMSMGYRVPDAATLAGLKAGDKITFDADQTDGTSVVTKIEKAK